VSAVPQLGQLGEWELAGGLLSVTMSFQYQFKATDGAPIDLSRNGLVIARCDELRADERFTGGARPRHRGAIRAETRVSGDCDPCPGGDASSRSSARTAGADRLQKWSACSDGQSRDVSASAPDHVLVSARFASWQKSVDQLEKLL
jgi:hypothetical protein